MQSFLFIAVFVALLSAFVLLLAKKVGIIEWMQVHGDKVISRMASCDFCLSFWMCTLLFVGVSCWYDEPLMAFGGIISCPITRGLVG